MINKLRLSLVAMLLLGAIALISVGSVTAQTDEMDYSCATGPGNCHPPNLVSHTLLKNGVWLEWELGTWWSFSNRFSHHEIYFYKQGEESSTASSQVEKVNILYGFISYSDLEGGATYMFHIRGKRVNGEVATSNGQSVTIPAEDARSSLPATKAGRKNTHPGGFSIEVNGNSLHFEWTAGVSRKYQRDFIWCRAVGSGAWQGPYHTHTLPATEVTRQTLDFNVAGNFFDSGTKYVCRVKPLLRNGRWGPMSNAATFKLPAGQ